MSIQARDWAYSLALRAPAKPVLVALAEHIKDQPQCWPSMNRLAEMTGYDRRTVRRAIRKLQDCGLIEVETRPGLPDKFTLNLSTTGVRESLGSESPQGQSDPGVGLESPGGGVRVTQEVGQSDPRTGKNRKGTGREPEKEAVELPDWMPANLWADFVEHRRKTKAPMTDIAQQRALKKLAAMRSEGQNIEAVVEQSIINGWKGLFPVKADRCQSAPGSRFTASIDALNSLFGDNYAQEHISGGHGLPRGSILEGNHPGDGGRLLGSARRNAG